MHLVVDFSRACGEKPFRASLKLTSHLSYLSSIYLRNMKARFVRIDRKIEIAENAKSSPKKVDLWANSGKVQHTDFQSLCACSESSLTNPIGELAESQSRTSSLRSLLRMAWRKFVSDRGNEDPGYEGCWECETNSLWSMLKTSDPNRGRDTWCWS